MRMFPPYGAILKRLEDLAGELEQLREAHTHAALNQAGEIATLQTQLIELRVVTGGIHVDIKRGSMQVRVPIEFFESFELQDGDELTVGPPAKTATLPVTWGDTHVLTGPGKPVRIPPHYSTFNFKNFDIPTHLIRLTGADETTFDTIGAKHIAQFQETVGIEAGMTILDLGSGIGRDAFQLFDMLDERGCYIGIDVTRDSIAWCVKHITKRYPNFNFYHFDAYNELYNPYGTKITADFRIPLEDASVDRIFLSSVFTHLLRDEVLHYMNEFRRILKPDGLVFASFFHLLPEVLESAKTKHNTAWLPKFDLAVGDGVFTNDPAFPRGAVGFTDDAMMRLIDEAGLRLQRPFLKGWWSGHYGDAAESGQDAMILALP